VEQTDEPAAAPGKTELRRSFGALRTAMDEAERAAARTAIRAHVLGRCAGAGWGRVAAYVPLRTEPGSVELLAALVDAGVAVLVPITLTDRDLDWAYWSPSGLAAPLGSSAIASADAVLVPALAVAADGTRLGRGGGSYDRALPRCAPSAIVAAVLFDGELVESLPRDEWDRPVTAAVTPSGWLML
jgi:5-formyltetrahydrofolate cyclo-ligase